MGSYKGFIGTYTKGGLGGGKSKNSNVFSEGIYTAVSYTHLRAHET